MRPLNEIIVHTTATRPEWYKRQSVADKVAEIRRWHTKDRGWSDIGYHFVIDRDGKTAAGRPLGRVGAHVKGHNTGTIGIALVGGFGGSENDQFEDHYTPEQDRALRRLISDLMREHGIQRLSGHNEYAAKACPCFAVRPWWQRKRTSTTPKPNPIAALLEALFSFLRRN